MKEVFKSYLPVLKKKKTLFFLMILSILFINILDVCIPVIYKEIADIFGRAASAETAKAAYKSVGKIGGIFALTWGFWRFYELCTIPFQARSMQELEQRCFAAIKQQKIEFFQNNSSGSLVKKAAKYINGFDSIMDWFFFYFLNNIFVIIFTFFVFVKTTPVFSIYFLIWVIIFIAWNVITSIYILRLDEKESRIDSKIGFLYTDSISNMLSVKTFAKEKNEQEKINKTAEELYQRRKKSWTMMFIAFAGSGILAMGMEFLLIYLMVPKWQVGLLTVGDFILFQSLVLLIIHRLWALGKSLKSLFKSVATSKEMVEIMKNNDVEIDKKSSKNIKIKKGAVEFQNISFLYDKEEDNVFENFNLKIMPNEKIALVGDSGSGKSTITKLILRFFEVQKGKVLIDYNDVKDFTYSSLRSNISLVPQNPELFHRSILENLLFVNEKATEEELTSALKKSHAYKFVTALPKGLDTIIGERGVKLSGGEKQRIAITRAFLENTKIVILDEATSALDSIIESEIQKGIFELIKNKTAIVIAHRLSTILKMDRIIVLESGKIVQEGTHSELIKQDGKYAEMWKHQSGGFIGN